MCEWKVELKKELMVNLVVNKGKMMILTTTMTTMMNLNLLIFSWIGKAKDMEIFPFFA